MSRTIKILVVLVAIVALWKVVSGGSTEVEYDFEPTAEAEQTE